MRTLLVLLLTALAPLALADNLIVTLHSPAQSQQRSARVTFDLLVLNSGPDTVSYQPLPQLSGTLRGDVETWVVALHAVEPIPPVSQLASGRFVRIAYSMDLPADATGRVVLDIPELETARTLFEVSDSTTPLDKANGSADTDSAAAIEPPNVSRIDRAFTGHFAVHEPIYYIYGTAAPAAKFQFSFKYRLTGEAARSSTALPALRGLYFAYTQRSLWDVEAKSSPFYDTSYMPELFYEWLAPGERGPDADFHWLNLQTGVQHESNGKAEADSRSLNIAYARLGFVLGPLTGWHVIVTPRLFHYLNVSEGLSRYRGYGDLVVALARNDAAQLSVTTRAGVIKGKGSVQVDLTQPINVPWINLHAYAHLQYFDGYGESLLNYNQRSSVWRAGLAFAR